MAQSNETDWVSGRYKKLEALGWDMTKDMEEPEPVTPLETLEREDFKYPVCMNKARTGIIEVECGFVSLESWR